MRVTTYDHLEKTRVRYSFLLNNLFIVIDKMLVTHFRHFHSTFTYEYDRNYDRKYEQFIAIMNILFISL